MTMKYLVELLPSSLFKQVHRSFIVGISHITSIGRNEIEIGEYKIPIGEKYRALVDLLIL
ncbi:LytTr DNA-binding domain protein [compost metagenome]